MSKFNNFCLVPLSLCSVISCVPDVFSIVPKGIDSPQGRHVILQCTLKKEFQKSYNLTWLVNGKLITNGERRYSSSIFLFGIYLILIWICTGLFMNFEVYVMVKWTFI